MELNSATPVSRHELCIPTCLFVRFQAATPNRHGRYPGIFALVNGLSRSGLLSPSQEQFRIRENAWYEATLIDPSTVDPTVYDRNRHPGATAWFKLSATDMIARTSGYSAILDMHGISWARVESDDPGEIVYDDPHQVITRPLIA